MLRHLIFKAIFILCILVLFSCDNFNQKREPLLIVFTNDSHSAVEPIKGMGGFEARALLLDSLRSVNENLILLDAGDMWQGSPYFNMFHGRVEVEGYNIMGYDAVTLGNHEFDFGMDTLARRISEMNFPVVCANYDFTNTPLNGLVQPYVVLHKYGWTVGVIGVGVNPQSLILESNYKGLEYKDPVETVNHYATLLKEKERCDVVVVLSHLGLRDDGANCSDEILVSKTKGVDFVLGGHTHQYSGVYRYPNLCGDSVCVMQERKAGRYVYCVTLQ